MISEKTEKNPTNITKETKGLKILLGEPKKAIIKN